VKDEVGHLVADRYRLMELVAREAMGRVWRGYDQLLDREVAVKQVILSHGLASEHGPHDPAELTTRETRIATRLRHPSIAATYDAVYDGGMPWIIMELVPGLLLSDVIGRDGPMAWDKVVRIGADLADALVHAHAIGAVHGELDANYVVLAGDRPVITDFASPRLVDAFYRGSTADRIVPNLGHVSPERIVGRPVQAPADLWGLGVILHTALAGRPPFEVGQVLLWVLREEPLPLRSPPHAGSLARIIEALTAMAPEKRLDAPAAAARLAALRGH
jgi:serine/threonine protein kinase